jgi:transposase-like protein
MGSLRGLCLTGVEGESVGIWVHRFSPLFRQFRRVSRLVAVDEAVLKVSGQTCYLWAEIDVDTKEVLAVYASRGFQAQSSSYGRYWTHVNVSHSY